jgi:hypothetical protein
VSAFLFARLQTSRQRLPYFMKTKRVLGLLLGVIVLSLAGCSTPTRSFNQDYQENSPVSPNYTIENVDGNDFKIRVYQGETYQGPQRIIYMKEAASKIADSEAKRRGWQEWQLNYIQERDQGWMHILVGEVIRQK